MKFLPNVRVAGFTTASLLIAAVALISNAQVTSAARPFNVTETPLPAPTATRPPIVATAEPTATPAPSNSSPSQLVNTVDPFVTLSGCAACLRNGEETEFTATIGNNGDTQAVNVQLYQKLPPYFQLVDVTASPRGTVIKNADEYTVDIGNLDPKEVITAKIRLRYVGDGSSGQSVLNAVIVRTTSQGDLEINNAAIATCTVCEVVLPVTGDETVPAPTLPGLMMLMGSVLAAMGTLMRRNKRA
jgi:uncharacterized repeat protein (TIGR01451 family)